MASLAGIARFDQRCLVVGGLLCSLNHTLDSIHQRQPLPALIAVSYMGVEQLASSSGKSFSIQARRVGQEGQAEPTVSLINTSTRVQRFRVQRFRSERGQPLETQCS